jgi:hypothetical protein
MRDDDFLMSLRREWRRQSADPAAIAEEFARHRRWARRRLVVGWAGAAAVLAALTWFAMLAFERTSLLYAIAALAYAAALPLLVVSPVKLRKGYASIVDEAPLGVLLHVRERLAATRREVRGARAAAAILLVSLGAVWLLAMFGKASPGLACWLTMAWGSTALLLWLWQRRASGKLILEEERCNKLISEFSA